jgi:hypothetical protein
MARTIEAERFVLVDKQGRPRMALETLPDDSPALTLLNEHGKPLVRLAEVRGKPLLQFMFEGTFRASLAVAPDASTALVIGTDVGSVTVGIMADEPCIVLRRQDGAKKTIAAAENRAERSA